jgi:hypothetical protein
VAFHKGNAKAVVDDLRVAQGGCIECILIEEGLVQFHLARDTFSEILFPAIMGSCTEY